MRLLHFLLHLGIDVAKATFEAALLVDGKMHQRSFAMTVPGFDALHAWMRKQEERVGSPAGSPDGCACRIMRALVRGVLGAIGGALRHPANEYAHSSPAAQLCPRTYSWKRQDEWIRMRSLSTVAE
jgi:hypothetical protein